MVGTPKKQASWDDTRDLFLTNYLLKATREGKKSDSGFKADVWNDLQQKYNMKFGPTHAVSAKQIQTRMQTVCMILNLS